MSKQRRIKKLVKGHLTQKKVDGDDLYTSAQDKIDRLAALDAMSNADLITALGITNAGKADETINIDGDSATFKNDFAPFDAAEQLDTDKDNIGDNRDILGTKVLLDAIFQDLAAKDATTALARATGTLQVLMDEAATVQELVNVQYDTIDAAHDGTVEGDAATVDAAQAAILILRTNGVTNHDLANAGHLVSVAKEKFTATGLDQLNADIDAQVAKVASLKAEIAAMTATAGVKIKSPTVPGYTAAGDSVLAHAAAGATGTGAGASPADVATLATAAKLRSTKDITADESSGSKAMLLKIDNA